MFGGRSAPADNPIVKIKHASNTSPGFTCANCPLDHGIQNPCTKSKTNTSFEFNFNQLLPILQQRFVDLASVYEKSKLQRVSKTLNNLIKPYQYTVVKDLIAHSNSHYPADHDFWKVSSYRTHAHPEHEAHLARLQDLIVNRKFNGVSLPDKWITQALNQRVAFYLIKLHIHDSNLTNIELKSLCDYGTLQSLFLENINVNPPPKAYEIAMWTTSIKKFHVNIKNFVCEKDWPKFFTQFSDKRTIRYFVFTKVSPVFNPNDFDKLVRTRMLSTKEARSKKDDQEVEFRITFDDRSFKNMKKKSFQMKLDRIFAGVFKRVPKVQYETFSSTDRFVVDGKRVEKSSRTYFFVNSRAIDAVLKEAEEQKITTGMKKLYV